MSAAISGRVVGLCCTYRRVARIVIAEVDLIRCTRVAWARRRGVVDLVVTVRLRDAIHAELGHIDLLQTGRIGVFADGTTCTLLGSFSATRMLISRPPSAGTNLRQAAINDPAVRWIQHSTSERSPDPPAAVFRRDTGRRDCPAPAEPVPGCPGSPDRGSSPFPVPRGNRSPAARTPRRQEPCGVCREAPSATVHICRQLSLADMGTEHEHETGC